MKKNILLSMLFALSLCAINHVQSMEQNVVREVHEDVFFEYLRELKSKLNEMKQLFKKRNDLGEQEKRILKKLAEIDIQKEKDAPRLCYATDLRHKKAIQKWINKVLQLRSDRKMLSGKFEEKNREYNQLEKEIYNMRVVYHSEIVKRFCDAMNILIECNQYLLSQDRQNMSFNQLKQRIQYLIKIQCLFKKIDEIKKKFELIF